MSKILTESEIVTVLQNGLSNTKIAAAHFSGDREYEYLIFDDIADVKAFFQENDCDSLDIDPKEPDIILFSIDVWLIFATPAITQNVFNQLAPIFNEDYSD